MITLQKKLLLLSVCVLSILMICTSAFAGGKTGKSGEPGTGCTLPEGCTDWKFSGTPYEGTLTLSCALDLSSKQCIVKTCSVPEMGVDCVDVYLTGTIFQVGNSECSGDIPQGYPYSWGEMEKDAFKNLKPGDIRGCILASGYFDPDGNYHYWFNCTNAEDLPFFNVYDAAKVRYNTDMTVVTATVKVKELIPINCTY